MNTQAITTKIEDLKAERKAIWTELCEIEIDPALHLAQRAIWQEIQTLSEMLKEAAADSYPASWDETDYVEFQCGLREF